MGDRLILRWHVGVLGWLFLAALMGSVVFAIAALDPDVAAGLAEQRRGGFISLGQSGRYNWIAAAIALATAGVALKFGWKWADMVAVTADHRGLTFHRSISREPLTWKEVTKVAYAPSGKSGLLRVMTAHDIIVIDGVDPESGPEFARTVTKRWVELPLAPPPR